MSVIIIICFAIVWSGLVMAAALIEEKSLPGEAQRSRFWLAHLAVAVVPVGVAAMAPILPGMGAAMPVLADLPRLPSFMPAEATAAGAVSRDAGEMSILPMLISLAALLWLAGAIWFAGRFVLGRIRLLLIVARACPVLVARDGTPVLVTTEAMTPFAIGYLRPVIVLPAVLVETLGEDGVEPVIDHEACHIARRDPGVSDLLTLVSALLWVSPFIRTMVARWRLSAELACDDAALAGADAVARKRYAQILLSAFRISAASAAKASATGGRFATGRALPCPPAAFSTSQLKDEKMRILQIMRGPMDQGKGPMAAVRTGLLALGLLAVGSGAGVIVANPAIAADAVSIVDGKVTSRYGERSDPLNPGKRQHHHGIDFRADEGTPIYAPADGMVTLASDTYKDSKRYGYVVVMESAGGIRTVFAHLKGYDVKTGDRVIAGQKIAEVGNTGASTGPHVHIETYVNGEMTDPTSVWAWLDQ